MKSAPKIVKKIQESKIHQEAESKSISFSQLSVYLNCPYCWYKSYVLKEAPFVPTIHLIFGTAIHETIQEWLEVLYNQTVKAATEMDLNAILLEKLRKLYSDQRKAYGKDFSTPKELQGFYEDGVAILDFVKKHRKVYFDTKSTWLVGTEIPLLVPLKDKFYFKGFIDALFYNEDTKKWLIVDFKTSGSGWKSEKTDKVKTSQLILYKEFLHRMFDIPIEDIEIQYFIVKRKIWEEAEFSTQKKRVQIFEPANGKPSVKKAVEFLNTFTADTLNEDGSYQQKDYQKNVSEKSCKWCLFKDSCQSQQKILS